MALVFQRISKQSSIMAFLILAPVPLPPDASIARYCEDESSNQLIATPGDIDCLYKLFTINPHDVTASTSPTRLMEILGCLTGAGHTMGFILWHNVKAVAYTMLQKVVSYITDVVPSPHDDDFMPEEEKCLTIRSTLSPSLPPASCSSQLVCSSHP